MAWVIMHPGPPPMYVKDYAAYGVTYRASEADRFETEMEATKRLLELRLPRDWLVIAEIGPQGKHICCWERENPHRCILCCQCGKRFEPAEI